MSSHSVITISLASLPLLCEIPMLALFAQVRNQNANQNPDDFGGMPLEMLLAVVLGCLAVGLLIAIFYMLTLSKALSRCRPRNRTMEPGHVWLLFIPFLNIVWQFIVVNRVTESLKNEFRDRGWSSEGDFGQGVGMAMCIMGLLGWIPLLGLLLGMAQLICFVMFWVKIAGYSSQLARGDDDYDDEDRGSEDDEDRLRRKREDYSEDQR